MRKNPVLLYSPAVVRIDVFDAAKYLVDIFLESSLEPFNNNTLYTDFTTELEVLLTPWKVKIARLLVDDDRYKLFFNHNTCSYILNSREIYKQFQNVNGIVLFYLQKYCHNIRIKRHNRSIHIRPQYK